MREVFTDPIETILCEDSIELSEAFDRTKIQDSSSWRNLEKARKLAKALIDERGSIKSRALYRALSLLEENLYSLGPDRHHDAWADEHILKMLRLFFEEKELSQALKRISKPEGNNSLDRLIRTTLGLSDATVLTDAHARMAALSALLTRLRQNVGSCFATAPAILIQHMQPLQFLTDIGRLFATGRLERVYEGVEYAVPLSLNWGVGDLFKPFSLRELEGDPLQTLAYSPGLQAALRAAGVLNEETQSCASFLKESGIGEKEMLVLTMDEVIKQILFSCLGVTQEDVLAFERGASLSGMRMLFEAVPSLSSGEKSRAIQRYIKGYDRAKNAFKSLTDNALLKAWEFSLASLSEAKADFAKWNLYISLGIRPEEPHGIGRVLYEKIEESVNALNSEIEQCQSTYEHLYTQAKYLEGRLQRSQSENESAWLQAEYRIRRHEINRALHERDEAQDKARRLTNLLSYLVNFYGKKIPEYFQEVYDAEMHDVSVSLYDDSPAGFRLLYKHGRANPSLWTPIRTAEEYIQYLTSFFVATEIELIRSEEMEGLEKELTALLSALIATIKHPQFLESSFFRLAQSYNESVIDDPLNNMERVKRKPWVYISGGTMSTLISCYYNLPEKPREVKKWVESPNELLAFFIDSCKELPRATQHLFEKDPKSSLLAFSPTHAFLLKPGFELFRKGWESSIYTYTWIRDHWMVDQKKMLDKELLDTRMMDFLVKKLLSKIPYDYQAVANHVLNDFSHSMTAPVWREQVLKRLSYEKWVRNTHLMERLSEEIDSLLAQSLPLFPEHFLFDKLEVLFSHVEGMTEFLLEKIRKRFKARPEWAPKYMLLTSQDLLNIAKVLLCEALSKTRTPIHYHKKIVSVMQAHGLSYPAPLLVADTNWAKNTFGFTLNPGTEQVDFWRFDEYGFEGRPITAWKRYLNGTEKKEWGLYNSPNQYGQY